MTATETVRALETCAITEAEALETTGAETIVALYRMAILELAPHLHAMRRQGVASAARRSRAA